MSNTCGCVAVIASLSCWACGSKDIAGAPENQGESVFFRPVNVARVCREAGARSREGTRKTIGNVRIAGFFGGDSAAGTRVRTTAAGHDGPSTLRQVRCDAGSGAVGPSGWRACGYFSPMAKFLLPSSFALFAALGNIVFVLANRSTAGARNPMLFTLAAMAVSVLLFALAYCAVGPRGTGDYLRRNSGWTSLAGLGMFM